MGLLYLCDNSGHVVPPDVRAVHPVAASGLTVALTTSGSDYTQTIEQGESYAVTFVGTAGKAAFAGITGVTSTAANIEWVFVANVDYVIHIPIGKTTLYCESNESSTNLYLRKLADTDG